MAFTPRRVERSFSYAGGDYTLVFDMETVARYEEMTGKSVFDMLTPRPGAMPQMSAMGAMLLAALAEHHPDLERRHAMEMLTDPAVQALFNEGLAGSMPQPGDASTGAGKTPPGNPPKRATKKGGAGKTF